MARRIATVVLIVAIVLSLPYVFRLTPEDIARLTPEALLGATAVMLVIYVLKTVTVFLPQIVLYFAAGIIFPPIWALLVTTAGIVIELVIGYYIGRYLGQEKVVRRAEASSKGRMLLAFSREKSLLSAFLPRFVPTPTDLGSMLFGALEMPLGPYMSGSLLGLVPRMIPAVLIGSSLSDPSEPMFLISAGMMVVVYGSAAILAYRVGRNRSMR